MFSSFNMCTSTMRFCHSILESTGSQPDLQGSHIFLCNSVLPIPGVDTLASQSQMRFHYWTSASEGQCPTGWSQSWSQHTSCISHFDRVWHSSGHDGLLLRDIHRIHSMLQWFCDSTPKDKKNCFLSFVCIQFCHILWEHTHSSRSQILLCNQKSPGWSSSRFGHNLNCFLHNWVRPTYEHIARHFQDCRIVGKSLMMRGKRWHFPI
jgi:hypothetical protein